MKNQNYYVLKTVYKLSKKNSDNFVSLETLISAKCPEKVITHLDLRNYLNYKREDRADFYSITLKGIEYIVKHKRDNINLILTIIAAISSIIGIFISLFGLYLSLY